ncbi:MAG: VCBS repeat-containing protein, partial [Candidatus Aenigmarchaeota archaeon]|nr:VCBS repeat-containing protein [Candidatus Aenigmarchaeota archaeon]
MQNRLKTLLELVVLPALILAFFSAGVSAMGLSLKANWSDGSMPELADLNNDSVYEIVGTFNFNPLYQVNVWYGNGTVYGNWPASAALTVNEYPAVGDINGGGEKEIIFTDQYFNGNLSVYQSTGIAMWSNDLCSLEGGIYESSPALVDLDGNGALDIIATCHIMFMYTSLYALDSQGNPVLGWDTPKMINETGVSPATSSDIIVISGGDAIFGIPFFVHAFYINGTEAWFVYPDGESPTLSSFKFPVIGNVDADAEEEIVVTGYGDLSSKIFVLEKNGSLENSWDANQTTPPSSTVLSDLNGDGAQDIVVYWNDTVYAWSGNSSLLWSQYVGQGILPPGSNNAPVVADI